MKLKLPALIVLFSFQSIQAYSCINEYRAKADGTIFMTDGGMPAPQPRFDITDKPALLKDLHEADSLYRISKSLEDYSDYGAKLIYLGRYAEAKHVFFSIEKKNPGLYATASNIGTLYELTGQLDSALVWIKRSMVLNPDSHFGSEWIHVKILEAKKAAKGNVDYFKTHSILGLDFGSNEEPRINTKTDLDKTEQHLYHQLCERMSFVRPTDPVVAQLLFDLGNISSIESDVNNALDIFKLAREYGYDSEVLDKREKYFTELKRKADKKNRKLYDNTPPSVSGGGAGNGLIIGAVLLLLAIVIALVLVKKRRSK